MSEAPKPAAPRAAGRAGRNTELPEHLKAYKGVWVFVEHDRGHVHPVSWELMGEARKLADKLGVTVSGVLLGGPDEPLDAFAKEAYAYGADRCYLMRDPVLKGYRNEPFTKGLTDLVNTHQPEIMLLGASAMGRDLAGSVATTLGTGLTADCTELNIDGRRLVVERRAEGGVQKLATALPALITMLEGTNEMRFASMDDMLRAGRCPVRKWSKDDAGIEDLTKIGLKGSPTIVSKVFGPTPRTQKADTMVVADSNVNDICLNLLQKIFTTHPTLEAETVERLSA